MRRLALVAAAALAAGACGTQAPAGPGAGGGSPSSGPVAFRTLLERQSGSFCVEGPDFAVATTREEWFGVAERQWGCQPLADPAEMIVRWDEEVGVAAWWGVRPCLGYRVETESMRREGTVVEIRAAETEPAGVCAAALGGLESFYAVDRGALTGAETIRFLLDGEELGRVSLSAGAS